MPALPRLAATLGHVFVASIYFFVLLAAACFFLLDGLIADELPGGHGPATPLDAQALV